MKRNPTKKGMERRKQTKDKSYSSRNVVNHYSTKKTIETCSNCSKELKKDARVLFVEEDVGRVFCSENCISDYFSSEVSKLEKEYFKRLSPNDVQGDERESLSHLRWITLQEPDEVWCEKTLVGDLRYTFISEFKPGTKRIWFVCVCLCLKGEPSFLYLAFPTRNSSMVNYFRKGEQIQWESKSSPQGLVKNNAVSQAESLTDGLANEWTEDETIRAQLGQQREVDDIPVEDFALYQGCLEETLEAPDEVWSLMLEAFKGLRLYHFIRYYQQEDPGVWYLIIARETEDKEQIEILEAFPTRDSSLVEHYRTGTQEVGVEEVQGARVIH